MDGWWLGDGGGGRGGDVLCFIFLGEVVDGLAGCYGCILVCFHFFF